MQRKNLDDERQEDQESHRAEQEEVMGQSRKMWLREECQVDKRR